MWRRKMAERTGRTFAGINDNPRPLEPTNKKQQKLRFYASFKENKNMRASSQFLFLFSLLERLLLSCLAERTGFEPAKGVNPYTLSKRAP